MEITLQEPATPAALVQMNTKMTVTIFVSLVLVIAQLAVDQKKQTALVVTGLDISQ